MARGDETELPGFDETLYVSTAGFEERALADLLGEYRAVRQAEVSCFQSSSDAGTGSSPQKDRPADSAGER